MSINWLIGNPFDKRFRKKAHPEAEIKKEIERVKTLMTTNFSYLMNVYLTKIEKKIDELSEKIDIILDLKSLKEKINKII